jgi:general secretion pathway protein D
MTRWLLSVAALLALATPGWAQEDAGKKLSFTFRDASIDAVLRYVSSVTGWIFVLETPPRGTITACSNAEVPVSRCLEFLNASLRRHELFVLNPAAPRSPAPGDTLRVLDLAQARRHPSGLHVGTDPAEIPSSDEARSQLFPLKSASAAEVGKDFGDVFRRLLGDGGQLAVSPRSNTLLASGPSEGIRRIAEILSAIDRTSSGRLQLVVVPLEYTGAAETAKTLNDVFKREAVKVDPGAPSRLPGFFRAMGDSGSPASAVAEEGVRITPDVRSNSLIVGATEETLVAIRTLVAHLDRPSAALNTYVVRLVNSDAASMAVLLNNLLRSQDAATAGRSGQTRSDGTLSPGQVPFAGTSTPSPARGSSTGGSRR